MNNCDTESLKNDECEGCQTYGYHSNGNNRCSIYNKPERVCPCCHCIIKVTCNESCVDFNKWSNSCVIKNS